MISVVIPAYNSEKYMEACLNSLVQQTFKDFEIIIINDGSTDRTRDIALSFKNRLPGFKYVEQKNLGPGLARNIGIDQTEGNYIFFMDSDDRILPNTFYRLRNFIIEKNCDIVQCGICYDYGKYGLIKKNKKETEEKIFTKNEAMVKLIKQETIKNFAGGKLYKRKVIGDIRFPEIKCFEDFDWMQRLVSKCERFGDINQAMYLYRQHSQSLTSNSSYSQILKNVVDERTEFIRQNFPDLMPIMIKYKVSLNKEKKNLIAYLSDLLKRINHRINPPYERIQIPY